jgi:hypothetical protein
VYNAVLNINIFNSVYGLPMNSLEKWKWSIPYIDQPLSFWQKLNDEFGDWIKEVYLPLPIDIISSGEPVQPDKYKTAFLKSNLLRISALLNPMILSKPVEDVTPQVIEVLKKWQDEYNLASATVANLTLAMRVHESIPELSLTASCLMQISRPNQVEMINGIFNYLVPSPLIVRDIKSLKALKEAFRGKIRILVNECCLPGCPYRPQHFFEMGCNHPYPLSLCNELLDIHPWMRLTGGWILPQHLHLFDHLCDEYKLGGRVTLRNPDDYYRVFSSYLNRKKLLPNEIGGGPGMVRLPIEISESYYKKTLHCRQQCHTCTVCQDYFTKAVDDLITEKAMSMS